MKWPWVSRLAFDTVVSEATYLREQLSQAALAHAALEKNLVRISRSEAGLTEEPRQPREPIGPMPDELVKYIAGFDRRETRREMTSEAWRRRGRGIPWETIKAEVMAEEQES
jgi:hypothetical protein